MEEPEFTFKHLQEFYEGLPWSYNLPIEVNIHGFLKVTVNQGQTFKECISNVPTWAFLKAAHHPFPMFSMFYTVTVTPNFLIWKMGENIEGEGSVDIHYKAKGFMAWVCRQPKWVQNLVEDTLTQISNRILSIRGWKKIVP